MFSILQLQLTLIFGWADPYTITDNNQLSQLYSFCDIQLHLQKHMLYIKTNNGIRSV